MCTHPPHSIHFTALWVVATGLQHIVHGILIGPGFTFISPASNKSIFITNLYLLLLLLSIACLISVLPGGFNNNIPNVVSWLCILLSVFKCVGRTIIVTVLPTVSRMSSFMIVVITAAILILSDNMSSLLNCFTRSIPHLESSCEWLNLVHMNPESVDLISDRPLSTVKVFCTVLMSFYDPAKFHAAILDDITPVMIFHNSYMIIYDFSLTLR